MAFAQVQTPVYANTFGTSLSNTITAAGANHLLVALLAATNGVTITGPSGWTLGGSYDVGGGTPHGVRCWYKVAAGGETSVSVSTSANSQIDLEVFEYSGNATASPQDGSAVTADIGSVTTGPLATGSISTAASGDLLMVAMGQVGNASGWSNAWTNSFTRSNQRAAFYESAILIAGAASSYSTQENWTGSDRTISVLVAFTAATAAAGRQAQPIVAPSRAAQRSSSW